MNKIFFKKLDITKRHNIKKPVLSVEIGKRYSIMYCEMQESVE